MRGFVGNPKALALMVFSYACVATMGAAFATDICNPSYSGVTSSAILCFQANDRALQNRRGFLELTSDGEKKRFPFTTTASNGFSRDYVMLSELKNVDGVIMERNSDFTTPENDPAMFIITPNPPIKFYYATMQDTSGLHDFLSDDTWKLTSAAGNSAYCAVAGHEAPARAPADFRAALVRVFGDFPDVPDLVIVRCVGSKLMACLSMGGCEKADTRRSLPSATAFCRDNPGSIDIPTVWRGYTTIYAWRCVGSRAVAGEVISPVDAQGYKADHWQEIPSPGE